MSQEEELFDLEIKISWNDYSIDIIKMSELDQLAVNYVMSEEWNMDDAIYEPRLKTHYNLPLARKIEFTVTPHEKSS